MEIALRGECDHRTSSRISEISDQAHEMSDVFSWRVLDISIAMAYGMLSSYGKCNRSISAAAAVLRGYHSVYPLADMELENLLLLIACR